MNGAMVRRFDLCVLGSGAFTYHPAWQPGQAEIAPEAAPVEGRPKGAAAPLPLSGPGSLGCQSQGYAPQRVGNDVRIDIPIDVGVTAPEQGRVSPSPGGRGRAAEFASEAARAEGASPMRCQGVTKKASKGKRCRRLSWGFGWAQPARIRTFHRWLRV
jgi:hypothetical protein